MTDPASTSVILRPNLPAAYPVLVVDDDELIREYLTGLFSQAGYEVHSAGSGEHALRLLESTQYPLVVTDLQMPEMDGLTLCRSLRQISPDKYTYILILTAHNDKTDIVAGLSAGADDYVSKTASAEELLARLEVGRRIVNLEQSLRHANTENRRLAVTDALTGARNRLYLMKYLPREFERCRRYQHAIAVLACDIDHFKRINDGYGHDVGDEVLQSFVTRAESTLRTDSDWIARSGGEEFVVVLPETPLQGAVAIGERLRRLMSATPLTTSAGPLSITVSIGATSINPTAQSPPATANDLLRLADDALYASKENGRDQTTALVAGQKTGLPEDHRHPEETMRPSAH